MKVLIITESLRLGGAETVAAELANSLVDYGLNVYLCAAPGQIIERLDSRIEFYSLAEFGILTSPGIVYSLLEIVRKIKPDIIHSQSAASSFLVGLAVKASKIKSKVIFTHHSKTFSRLPLLPSSYLLRLFVNHFIAITRLKYGGLISMGVLKDSISLIPNMVDCDAIENSIKYVDKDRLYKATGIDEKSYVICMAGRLLSAKGFDRFIKVLADCSRVRKDMNFVGLIIGEGPFRGDLEALYSNLTQNTAQIKFVGYQEDVYQYLAISDLVLFPSSSEVLPMFLIEATAAGVPIVCSNIPGNNDIVKHGVNGFLVHGDEGNEKYCEYIFRIICDKRLSRDMSLSGKKIGCRVFDKRVVVEDIIAVYENVIS